MGEQAELLDEAPRGRTAVPDVEAVEEDCVAHVAGVYGVAVVWGGGVVVHDWKDGIGDAVLFVGATSGESLDVG